MSIKDFFVKEKPVFTGITRGLGGFGFGKSGGGGGGGNPLTASGGTTTYIHNGYKVHCYYNYTPSPEKVFNVTSGTGEIQVFLIGGGGTGNYDSGAGGGGGSAVYGTGIPVDPSMNMAITVDAGAPAANSYYPGSEPTSDYLNDHGGKPAIIAHPGGNIISHGGNPGGTSFANPYGVSPISPGLNQSDGLFGSGGGAHKSSSVSSPIAAGALRTSYPTPSAGTFTVHRNVGGSIPAGEGWQGAGGGGAGGSGGNTGAAPGIERLFRVATEAGDGGIGYDAAANVPWMTTAGGESGYFGGGGGGGGSDPASVGTGGNKGLGGGGVGDGQSASAGTNKTAGVDDTGGGGGGGDGGNIGQNGGAGTVFIAYQHTAPTPAPYGGTASGGTVSAGIPSGDYRYFVINRATPSPNSNLVLNQECPADNISILVVGGGGGGGSGHAGGGGAGGVTHLAFGMAPIPSGTHAIAVGDHGAGGPAGNPNIATNGGDSTFGPNPSNHYMVAKGGGGGGGWIDGSSNPSIGRGQNGGSGGGSTGTAVHARGYNLALPSTQRAAGRARHYGNPGGYGSYAGGGGGGAGSLGQTTNQAPPGIPSNPPNIPADHPNYPNGGGGGTGPFPTSAPYNGPASKFINAPYGSKVWPAAADYQSAPSLGGAGGFGGFGASFPEFPGPVISPGVPSPQQADFQNAITTNGIFAGGGGGGAHGGNNPYTGKGGGAGGMGGGGYGGHYDTNQQGQKAVDYTGSGGGGCGNQPEVGGDGGEGIVIVKIKMS
jgi:hypothetical protein